jgi:hypothetical protein
MLSAFGVDHGSISKADRKRRVGPSTVPDSLAAIIPGSTVRAYEYSPPGKKLKNASRNFGAITAGGVAGGAVGAALAAPLIRKIPIKRQLLTAPKLLQPKGLRAKPMTLEGSAARNYAQAGAWGVGSTAGSTLLGTKSYKKIRRENRQHQ